MMSQNQLRANNFLPKLAQHAQESQMEETWVSISLRAAEWEKVVGSSVESMVMTTECQDHLMTSQKLQRANNESDCLQNWCFEFNKIVKKSPSLGYDSTWNAFLLSTTVISHVGETPLQFNSKAIISAGPN